MDPEQESEQRRASEGDTSPTSTQLSANSGEALPASSVGSDYRERDLSEAPELVESGAASSEQPSHESPDPATAVWYAVDARYVGFTRMLGLIFTAILAVLGLFGIAVLWWFFFGTLWWIFGLAGYVISIVALFLLAILWPRVEFRHIAWRLDERGLEIRRGVFWKHHLVIPTARLQHADISQGPVQRLYGLAKLTVYTAGTFNASVELDGLTSETAAWIRDQLIKRREELDVV